MLDSRGNELPLEARPLVRWPDGSVKVALLDTEGPRHGGQGWARLTLEYGYEVSRSPVRDGVTVSETPGGLLVDNGVWQVRFDREASGLFTSVVEAGEELTRPDAPARITLVDDAGNVYDTLGSVEGLVVEEAGPLRTVIRADGHHTGDAGELFSYQIRFTFYQGAPGIVMSYRWGNDRSEEEFTKFRRIRLELPLALDDGSQASVGADEMAGGSLAEGVRLEQLHDDSYTVGDQKGERAPGWIVVWDSEHYASLVCPHFWQLYPKAIGAEDGMLYLDICPFPRQFHYNDCSELDLIKLYYYLQDGRYKVRQGVTKIHEVMVTFGTEVLFRRI